MARAIWKGSVAFGLVNIPVELYGAVRDTRPKFRLLHAADKSPVRFERVCARDGKTIAWEELVKGYEYEKGRFVVLSKEDFRLAALEKTRTVDIRAFVKAEEIDDRFFETSYFIVPAKGGERAYALLREAIRQEKRVGIATIILREKSHLAAVEVTGDAMVLTLMRYADELVDVADLRFPTMEARKAELDMARTLVANFEEKWDPSKYSDEYRNNLMKVIKAKLKGRAPRLEAEPEVQSGEVVDLMERLRKSLEATGRKPAKAARATKTSKARKASARAKKRSAA
jgi:DNA end-binding protein Ku